MENTIGFPVITLMVFIFFVVAGILIDLYYHKSDQEITIKDAALWSIFWILVSFVFGMFLYWQHGSDVASLFFAGYILEKSLSVDNLFVFAAIFSWFAIPSDLRHRVLYWGIVGAIVFRLIFVVIGTSLMSLSGFVEIIFGLIVGWTAYMMLKKNDDEEEITDYSNHFAYKLVHKFFPVWLSLRGDKFFDRITVNQVDVGDLSIKEADKVMNDTISGKDVSKYITNSKTALYANPLFLCLVIFEISDVMFAFDSVPAIIAVSKDPLIIYSAMIFAILGLRTMYFLLEAMKQYFIYLEKAVVAILFYIAGKLIINATSSMYDLEFHIHHNTSLIIILTLLLGSIVLSLVHNKVAQS